MQALADPYFKGLAKVEREPSARPIAKVEFEFERRRLNMDDVRELIYREVRDMEKGMPVANVATSKACPTASFSCRCVASGRVI